MRTILGLAAIAALSAPLPAAASDWWRVTTNDTSTAYIDIDSLKTDGPWIRAEHTLIYRSPSEQTRVKTVHARVEFNCPKRVSRYRLFRAIDLDGRELHNMTDPDDLAEHPAQKNTIGGDVLDFVCGISRERAVRVANPLTDRP
ncbi:surface-adhesin E family protein [Sphingomonas sp. G-3-2-10]|uniref:surface-adhesin E family protein n=1 Tax=Sphingomonas sp. G-3-2-10 TaxID=2728838 RepID=UPI00146AA00B|nr:surface-adhesin E family protein [Sphingomonas sp. G-3-2-10]NML06135.1 hypothetical protein [Sphingomonas sp. G-3-2-10]